MTDRICSCCGELYTDDKGHDLDKCIETCQSRLHEIAKAQAISLEDLERAFQRKIANLKQALREEER